MKIIIIGGVTAGMSAVSKVTGGSRTEVVVYEKGAICSCGTCGLPYYLADRKVDIRQAVATMEETLRTFGVTAYCRHEVPSVACDRKQVMMRNSDNGQVLDDHYDKLVIAVDSRSLIPDVPGVEKVGVQVSKTVEGVIFLREFTEALSVHGITIIGGSFTGLELAKTFLRMDHSVRIIEREDQLLSAFDREISTTVQRELEENGVKIHLGETLRGFTGGIFTEKAETSRRSYDMDLAMMAVGVTPDIGCLAGSGISTTPQGGVIINKSMKTDVPGVYAVGDCTCPLGGSLRTSPLKMADLEIAGTGFTEQEVKEQGGMGSRVETALVTANDRPGLYPNANQITVKMVHDGANGRILGTQTRGKKNVITKINMFAVAIESGMTPEQLGNVDPPYSSVVSSIWGPVQVACHDARQAGGNHMGRTDVVSLSFSGEGAIRQPPAELKKMGICRALVVTDRFLYEISVAKRVGRVLSEGNTEYAIYYQVRPNSTIQVVNECLMATRTLEVDVLMAMRSGPAIDTAKAVSIVMANGGDVEGYEGTGKSARPRIPIVAVSATAGTGSEVISFCVVTNIEKHSKMAMVDTDRMMRITVNDIDFIMSMPPKLTAPIGMDALTHALEAMLLVRAAPFTDRDALQAIGTICEDLPKAISDGDDEGARTMMAYAEYVAGMTSSNVGLRMVHAMAHALGGRYSLPHGIYNAVLLPCVLEYNGVAPEVRIRFEKIAETMGLEAAADQTTAAYDSSPGIQTVPTVMEAVRQLSQQVGIPQSLSLLKPVKTEDFRILAELAMEDTCVTDNAIRPTLQEVIQVYHHAYQSR